MYIKVVQSLNSNYSCIPEADNNYSKHAIVVQKISSNNTQMIGHVPDKLAEILFNPLAQDAIKLSCRITEQSRPAIEGTWVQGGGIEIPCIYEIHV